MMSSAIVISIMVSLFLIALFSGIEMAFATANRLSIELKKQQGLSSGKLLSRLMETPSRLIGTLLVGYNLFVTTFVLLVSAVWLWLIQQLLEAGFNVVPPVQLLVEILLSTAAVLILGEVIPRAVFKARSDFWLLFLTRTGFLGFCHQLFYPIATVLVGISEWLLKYLFNIRLDNKKEAFARSDLDYFYQNREYNDESSNLNRELFEAALSLPSVKVRECLVPRKEIEGVDIRFTVEDVRQRFVKTKLSKMVVYDGNIDHILGYIHQLDLFKNPATIKEILLPIPAIPESMSATDLINKFTRERKSIAWVVDEFGGTAGIVTMEDVLEEIFGEIKDEYDVEEFEEKKLSEDEFILSGRLELDYLNEKYGLEFPENESETLSGYIIHQHETIPHLKERIIIGHYEFEVLSVSDTRIEIVRVKVLR